MPSGDSFVGVPAIAQGKIGNSLGRSHLQTNLHSTLAALGKLERHEEAIANYDRALAIQPDYALAWVNKAKALDVLGRHEEAKQSRDRAAACKSKSMNV
ncbi:tetratricopeptide repeat protein [bacterium]|nr:tetratricopeptide repeat protein [bacterium]